MKKITAVLALAAMAGSTTIALADSVTGTILAYDRKANVIVLKDKTVWSLDGSKAAVPEGMKAGDKVTIETEDGGEDGIGTVEEISLAE